MNRYPIRLPAGETHLFHQVHRLLESQVKAYHKHYHMGENSSVPLETAQGLLDSMSYALTKANVQPGEGDMAAALARGQAVVQAQAERCREFIRLVRATAPGYASDFYQDTLAALEGFLERYDPLFFAHQVPAFLDYPLLDPVSEYLQGVDFMWAWLHALWWENQILHCFPDDRVCAVLEASTPDFWGTPVNMAEQPLSNGLGRSLLGLPAKELLLTDTHRAELLDRLAGLSGRDLRILLDKAMEDLLAQLALPDLRAAAYAKSVVPQLLPRLRAAIPNGDLSRIFLG